MNLSSSDYAFEPISLSDANFLSSQSAAAPLPDGIASLTPNQVTPNGTLLPPGFEPSNYDVICGRGKGCANWIGNRRFRVTISMNKDRYVQAPTKLDKSLVVDEIVKTIAAASPSTGGFIKKDEATGRWYKITDQQARDKCAHAMRDAVAAVGKTGGRRRKSKSRKNHRRVSLKQVPAAAALVPFAVPSRSDSEPRPIQVSNRIRNSIRASLQGSFIKDPEFAAFLLSALGGDSAANDESDFSLLSENNLFRTLQDTAAVQV